eukprot:jgi/Psemu1/29592/gm1.29592_g
MALSLEVTTCFTALTTKVYLVSRIIQSEPRPDIRKMTLNTSLSKKKGKGKKKKPTPHAMVNFFLYKVDNDMTGVLGVLTRKQISEQLKDDNMNNKWVKFESLLRNVHDEIGGGDTTSSLYGRNVVNYGGNKPPGNNSKETGSDGDNGTKTNEHKGKNNKRGSPDTGDSLKPKANKSKQSGNGAKTKGNSKETGSDGDNVTKTNQHNKGKNNKHGSLDTGNGSKQKGNKSKQSGNGAKAKGAKKLLAVPVATETAPTANKGKVVPSPHAHVVSKVMENAAAVSAGANASTVAPSLTKRSEMGEKDGTNDWEEKVPHWDHTMNVTLPKFLFRVGRPLESTDISVVLKEPDPEILYPIYQINEEIHYVGGQVPDQIGEVVKYLHSEYKHYKAYPGGYGLVFQKGETEQKFLWCPFFDVAHLKVTNPPMKEYLIYSYVTARNVGMVSCREVINPSHILIQPNRYQSLVPRPPPEWTNEA